MVFNRFHYVDCLTVLHRIPDDSIDLCLTDPPWSVDFKQYERDKKHHGRTLSIQDKIHYKDDYPLEWHLGWFSEISRICDTVVVAISNKTEVYNWWIETTKPLGVLIAYFKNGPNGTKISKSNNYIPHLVYSKSGTMKKMFRTNVIEFVLKWGFLKDRDYYNPTVKDVDLWERIIRELKPRSVIDPFAGSGTTMEACLRLGINCICFEIDEGNREDHDFRMIRGKEEFEKRKRARFKQSTLGDIN